MSAPGWPVRPLLTTSRLTPRCCVGFRPTGLGPTAFCPSVLVSTSTHRSAPNSSCSPAVSPQSSPLTCKAQALPLPAAGFPPGHRAYSRPPNPLFRAWRGHCAGAWTLSGRAAGLCPGGDRGSAHTGRDNQEMSELLPSVHGGATWSSAGKHSPGVTEAAGHGLCHVPSRPAAGSAPATLVSWGRRGQGPRWSGSRRCAPLRAGSPRENGRPRLSRRHPDSVTSEKGPCAPGTRVGVCARAPAPAP